MSKDEENLNFSQLEIHEASQKNIEVKKQKTEWMLFCWRKIDAHNSVSSYPYISSSLLSSSKISKTLPSWSWSPSSNKCQRRSPLLYFLLSHFPHINILRTRDRHRVIAYALQILRKTPLDLFSGMDLTLAKCRHHLWLPCDPWCLPFIFDDLVSPFTR